GQRQDCGYTQIGIPASFWPQGQHAGRYASYEADVLNALMKWQSISSNVTAPAGVPGSPPERSWMTVMAALAHEVGHVRWYEMNVRKGHGQQYDFKRLNNCTFFQ